MRTVYILRDPRDVAVSQMHYIKQLGNHFAHQGYMALPSDHERLLVSIRGGELGGRKLQSLDERYRQFLRWEREGGGSAEAQRLAVEGVARQLGVEERTMGVVEDLFGVGRTFRKGQIGGWLEEFSA